MALQNDDKREQFFGAYSQLVVHAFPVLVTCLRDDIDRAALQALPEDSLKARVALNKDKVPSQPCVIQLDSDNGLIAFVNSFLRYFFDMRFSLDQIDKQKEAEDEDD